ncbi:MAG: Alpha/beta knot methyltransferase [Monoraphidium minutum]|nr:MAG: Alpha/beta knot methyltransferase [Monoraphidium minutum]
MDATDSDPTSIETMPTAEAAAAGEQQQHQREQEQQRSAGEASCSNGGGEPKCFVIVYNVSKKHNIGTLLRSCTAFGVAQVCLVGARQFNTFGSHGSCDFVDLRHFATIEECCEWLRREQGCRILGVEIDEGATAVQSHPFTGNTAFMLGNEGQGLSAKQLRLCDALVYIPQHGPGTASLNVTIAASIVLHHFALWAAYPERRREGAKFDVGARPQRTSARGESGGIAAGAAAPLGRPSARRPCRVLTAASRLF